MASRRYRYILALVFAASLAGCNKAEQAARLAAEAAQAEKNGEHETAIARWTSALKLNPRNGEAYLRRAALYEVKGDRKAAISDYSAYLRLPARRAGMRDKLLTMVGRPEPFEDPKLARASALCRRSFLYAKEGEFEKALADSSEAQQIDSTWAFLYISRGQVLEMRHEPEKALAWYTKAVDLATNDATGYTYRGLFYVRLGKPELALADLDEALRLEPGDFQALLHRGIARASHGEADKALEDLDEAVRVDPAEPAAHAGRGALLLDRGEFDRAFDDFNQVLLSRPNDPVALAQRGFAWGKKGNTELALKDLNEAIRRNPSEAYFYAWRGMVYGGTNELDKAMEDLDRAIRLNGNESRFYASRGSVHAKRQEYGETVADCVAGIRINPGTPDSYNGLAWLRATCPDDSFRNGSEAVELANRACSLTGFGIHTALDTLAAAYAEAGDFEEAINCEIDSLRLASIGYKKRPAMEERLALYQNHKPFRQKPGE